METTESELSATTSTCSFSRRSSCSSAPSDESSKPRKPSGLIDGGTSNAYAPTSSVFEIRQTLNAGRAVFATQNIPKDMLVFRSEDLPLSVLLREYQREVCGQCFVYDYGRDLAIRDKTVGFAFCSTDCHDEWRHKSGEVGIQAWSAVEDLVKKRSKEDNEMVDVDLPRPTSEDISKAWESVAAQAELLRVARGDEQAGGTVPVTKQHRKALSKALQAPLSPDVISFCVSGVLSCYHNPASWTNVLALAADNTPYHSIDDLHAFIRTYLHLLAILPLSLLPLVTAEFMFTLSSRDSHNSFGIRSLEDEGSEFFGYGCWPAASYFNHSCGPNIEKQRQGRAWEFRAGRDIEKGGELCITYLSGEERKLSREERMQRLKKNWGFECGCERCEVVGKREGS